MSRKNRQGDRLGGVSAPVKQGLLRKSWQPPRVLWTEKMQTVAYTCSKGTAPVSGTTCPP
jgi:hypothetical protein